MKHYREHIQAFISGELAPGVREEMTAHLASCSRCAEELAEQRRLWDVLAEVPGPGDGRSVWPAVQARTTAHGRDWFFGSSSWIRSGLAAGSLAAGLFLGVMVPGDSGVGAGQAQATALDETESLYITGTTLADGVSDLESLWFLDDTALTAQGEEGQES